MLNRSTRRIPIYQPDLSGNEKRYVGECLDDGWISSRGKFVERFEEAVAAVVGARFAVSVHNGTEAAHLALVCAGVGPGDEVIVPTFTYIASVNTIVQAGATPVFAECDPHTWQLDPADVARRITKRTKAVVPAHLYGGACRVRALSELAREQGLVIIEDCCEAIGTKVDGVHVGMFGLAGTFSFYGNKTITTGEGGMVVTSDEALAREMRIVRNQGMSLTRRYWHDRMGYNYRMTNIQAALGLAQIERLPEILRRKREIGDAYRRRFKGLPVTMQSTGQGVESSEWLVNVQLPDDGRRDDIMTFLESRGIETRPVFYCAHLMPMYARNIGDFPVSEEVARRGMSLPSYPGLGAEDIDFVVHAVEDALRSVPTR